MISVSIMINGNPIYTRSAVNVNQKDTKGKVRYDLDDDSTIWHDPDDGAVKLAIEMLKTIKEVK